MTQGFDTLFNTSTIQALNETLRQKDAELRGLEARFEKLEEMARIRTEVPQ